MYVIRCLGIWRIDKTENLPATLVKPIFEIINTVFPLRFDICAMSFRDIFRGSSMKLVNVHVERHIDEV